MDIDHKIWYALCVVVSEDVRIVQGGDAPNSSQDVATPDWDDIEGLTLNQRRYLRAYVQKKGHKGRAATAAELSRRTPERWLEDPTPEYEAAFEQADRIVADDLYDRGLEMVFDDSEKFSPAVWSRMVEARDRRFRQPKHIELSGEVAHLAKRYRWEGEPTPLEEYDDQ